MNEIKTYEEMNKQICGLLRLNGDNVSLYAAQRITELEAENAELRARLEKAVILPMLQVVKGNRNPYELVYKNENGRVVVCKYRPWEKSKAKARIAELKGGEE